LATGIAAFLSIILWLARVIQFSDETGHINHRGRRGTQRIILFDIESQSFLCDPAASSVVFSGISLAGFNIPYEN
jgi:hypothetical protein